MSAIPSITYTCFVYLSTGLTEKTTVFSKLHVFLKSSVERQHENTLTGL